MKKVLKDNLFLFKCALIGFIVIILDYYFPSIVEYLILFILVIIFIIILSKELYKLIIKKIIRNIKIKKVEKNDIALLDEYLNYSFNKEILIRNDIEDYIKFNKCLVNSFKEMDKDIQYKKSEMESDLKHVSKAKDKTVKEYISKTKEVLNIIYKYYNDNGIRNI